MVTVDLEGEIARRRAAVKVIDTKCRKEVSNWIAVEASAEVREALEFEGISGSDEGMKNIMLVNKKIYELGKNLQLKDPKKSWADHLNQAGKMYLEGRKEQLAFRKRAALKTLLNAADKINTIKANKNEIKKATQIIVTGRGYSGKGTKALGGFTNRMAGGYRKLANGPIGLYTEFDKNGGSGLLDYDPIGFGKTNQKKREFTTDVINQAQSEIYEDNLAGKMAKVITKHNDTLLKALHEAGIYVQRLAGRVSRPIHNPIKLLNPGGIGKFTRDFNKHMVDKAIEEGKEFKTVLSPQRAAKGIKHPISTIFDARNTLRAEELRKELGTSKWNELRKEYAFQEWKNTMKSGLDFNLSLQDVDHTDEKEIDDALREDFDNFTTSNQIRPRDERPSGGRPTFAKYARGGTRSYFWKSGVTRLDYIEKYGSGNFLNELKNDMHRTAKIIETANTYGPDAEDGWEMIRNHIIETNKSDPKLEQHLDPLDTSFKYLTGGYKAGDINTTARVIQNLKSFENIKRLGKVVISSINDPINIMASLGTKGMPLMKNLHLSMRFMWKDPVAFLPYAQEKILPNLRSADHKNLLRAVGIGFDHMQGASNRMGVDPSTFSGQMTKLDQTMFKWNRLATHDDVMRETCVTATSHWLALNAGRSFDKLPPALSNDFHLNGITPEVWDVWRNSEQHAVKNLFWPGSKKFLTPESLLNITPAEEKSSGLSKSEHFNNLLTYLHASYDEAVPGMDLTSLANAAKRRSISTPANYIIELLLQYKSYPINYVKNVLGRVLRQAPGQGFARSANIIKNFTYLYTGTMIAGYASESIKAFLKNQSPPPLTGPHAWETWLRAMEGPAGLYGDMVGAIVEHPYNAISEALGPVASDVGSVATYFYELGDRLFSHKHHKKSAGLITAELAKRNLPFASLPNAQLFLNYSLGKGVINHFYPGTYERQMHKYHKYTGQEPIIHH